MGNFLKIPGSDDFVTLFHYKLVRHPIMTGFFIMFWSTPVMTQGIEFTFRVLRTVPTGIPVNSTKGHLLFASVASTYIILAIKLLEEPGLRRKIGPQYEKYMETTPAFCPFLTMGEPKIVKKENWKIPADILGLKIRVKDTFIYFCSKWHLLFTLPNKKKFPIVKLFVPNFRLPELFLTLPSFTDV